MNLREYLLTCLTEESLEVGQACTKIMRFGLGEINPYTNHTNREELVKELNDVVAVIELLQDNGVDMFELFDREAIDTKKRKLIHYLEVSKKLNTLT